MRPNKPLTILVLALLLPGIAGAKSTDRQQPMDISADNMDSLLTDTSESSIAGNVVISQGTLKIEADKALVTRVKGEITKVTLLGSSARLQQTNDNGDTMRASAKEIVYFLGNDQIHLKGGVVIDQARGSMRGESIRYDIKSGRLTGGNDGNRLQMRILPKKTEKN